MVSPGWFSHSSVCVFNSPAIPPRRNFGPAGNGGVMRGASAGIAAHIGSRDFPVPAFVQHESAGTGKSRLPMPDSPIPGRVLDSVRTMYTTAQALERRADIFPPSRLLREAAQLGAYESDALTHFTRGLSRSSFRRRRTKSSPLCASAAIPPRHSSREAAALA
jgi:hypothetical protein